MGHRALELQQAGFTPLFAFEEAIGFMFGGTPSSIKDKDGVAAAAVFAEMAADLNQWGISVAQHLGSLRDLYGYFEVRSSYFTSDKPADIRAVFERLRYEGNYLKVEALLVPCTCGLSWVDGAWRGVCWHVHEQWRAVSRL